MSGMIEVKTAELEGAALDWAVAQVDCVKVEYRGFGRLDPVNDWDAHSYSPSTDWAQGGPLLEKHYIELSIGDEDYWANRTCTSRYDDDPRKYPGATMLIAACRAIVAAKLGDTVSVPAELVP
jgi:hypothetical protein